MPANVSVIPLASSACKLPFYAICIPPYMKVDPIFTSTVILQMIR